MSITKSKIWTYEEYFKLDDDKQYEIIEGELLEMAPAPTPLHQSILLQLSFILNSYVKENDLGKIFIAPCDVVFSEINTLQPDIFFISKENLGIIGDKAIKGVPDVVIEILSYSDPNRDKVKKYKVYEKFNVKEYWIVDSKNKKIDVYHLEKDKLEPFASCQNDENLFSNLLNNLKLSYYDLIKK